MSKTFVISEAGINHNGELKLAKELASVSKNAGADAVKYQTFWNLGRLREYELTKEETLELKDHCDMIEIQFMSTPHTMETIDFIDPLVEIHKIASPFLTDKEFLVKIASKGKPILLSTGCLNNTNKMATYKQIREALSWIPDADATLLHCVSKYPCRNPRYDHIEELKRFGKPVGLSDHSLRINVPKNLPVLEKHIKLHSVDCIDKNVSLYPEEFKKMVDRCKS